MDAFRSSFALHFVNNSERAGWGVFLFSEFFLYSPSQRSEDKEKTRVKNALRGSCTAASLSSFALHSWIDRVPTSTHKRLKE